MYQVAIIPSLLFSRFFDHDFLTISTFRLPLLARDLVTLHVFQW